VISEPIHTPFKSVAWLLKFISEYYSKNFKPDPKSTPDTVAAHHQIEGMNPQNQALPALAILKPAPAKTHTFTGSR
jgi:hypothetical protein